MGAAHLAGSLGFDVSGSTHTPENVVRVGAPER